MKLLIATLLLSLNISYSQNACFDVLFEGYNISSVTDDHEFIWVGTFDNGLISYNKDTSEIAFYNTSNSDISSNTILAVLKSNNRLYVSSENSLMAFSNNIFQEISTTIQGVMAVAPNGNLAVVAPYEFNIIDLDNEVTYTQSLSGLLNPSCCGRTTDIDYDANGKLWLTNYAFYEYDILTYDGSDWEVHDTSNSILPVESFYDFNGLTTHNDIVMISNNGAVIHKYENNIWSVEHSVDAPSIFNDQENIEDLLINAIEFDLEGDLWIGAGNYENTTSGKIAFKHENEWNFIYDEMTDLPGANKFEESQYDDNIMYAATNDGLLLLNKDCLRLSVANVETNSNALFVYPNPTNSTLNISDNFDASYSYKIVNSLGQVVLRQANTFEKAIDISRLLSGHYILIIESEDTVATRNIVKF